MFEIARNEKASNDHSWVVGYQDGDVLTPVWVTPLETWNLSTLVELVQRSGLFSKNTEPQDEIENAHHPCDGRLKDDNRSTPLSAGQIVTARPPRILQAVSNGFTPQELERARK